MEFVARRCHRPRLPLSGVAALMLGLAQAAFAAPAGAPTAGVPAVADAATATAAADRPTGTRPAPGVPATAPGEPQVRRIVVEDEGVRVEELRVRGVTTRIHVQPKSPGGAAYEILPPEPGRQLEDGSTATRGARGQRVWNVLAF